MTRIKGPMGSIIRGEHIITSRLVLGSSGAITTSTPQKYAGFSVAKTGSETGRYTITLQDKRLRVRNMFVCVVGADDAAFTDAKGIIATLRDLDAAEGAADGTCEIQLLRNTNLADTEVQDSLQLMMSLIVAPGTEVQA